MSVKQKLNVLLTPLFLGLFVAYALVLWRVLWPSFQGLELDEARQDMERVVASLRMEEEHLRGVTADWGAWDDAYQFARDHNSRFVAVNLVEGTFRAYDIDFLYFYDQAGVRLAGGEFRSHGQDPRKESSAEFPAVLPSAHPLRSALSATDGNSGYLKTRSGTLQLATHPILTSNQTGPARGLVVMGRDLTAAHIARLAERVRVDVQVLQHICDVAVALEGPPRVDVVGDQLIVHAALETLTGGEPLVLHATMGRSITGSAAEAFRYSLLYFGIAGLVIGAGILLVVNRVVMRPLLNLSRHVRRLAETGDLSARLDEPGDGEFGMLAREFNRMQSQIERLVYFDKLTELPNRAMFFDQVRRALAQAERTGRRLAVLFIDLDGFKHINDTLGHAEGDRLLQAVARRLQTELRGGDVVARLSGDEFTLLIENLASTAHAVAAAERVIALIAEPVVLAGVTQVVTGSVGIAIYPEHGCTSEDLLVAADTAMYEAKRTGKNRWHLHEAGDVALSVSR